MAIRRYSELAQLSSIADRFRYLSLRGVVGEPTFGQERWVNQRFYRSAEWKSVRDAVIHRDHGCDMGVRGFEIHDGIHIHHMNPMTRDDILAGDPSILNPEFLISVSQRTHNDIHYGDDRRLTSLIIERTPNDMIPWR